MLDLLEGERADRVDLTDEGCFRLGALLRDLHRATASFVPGFEPAWMPWWARDLGGEPRVIGHCDAVPWNVIVRDGLPVGAHRLGYRRPGRPAMGAGSDGLAARPPLWPRFDDLRRTVPTRPIACVACG